MTDPEDLKKQADYERLMRSAHVNRVRGEYAQAALDIKQVLEMRPDDLDAREFAADLLFARGELEKSADHYKAIYEADPSRASAEEKYAKATLMIAEGQRQKDLLRQMAEDPSKFTIELPPRSPYIAAALSAMPGLGHFYCGEYIKGAVVCGIAILSWLLFVVLLNPGINIVNRMGGPSTFFLCLAIIIHVYCPIDAAHIAEKSGKGPKSLAEP